jgi:5-oxoprolinase (ATP-hydrolysing)
MVKVFMNAKTGWQFWIDRGGTFTDVVARDPNGSFITHKLLSENPEKYPDATLQALRDILHIKSNEAIPYDLIQSIRLGTTLATNALLEKTGCATALIITKGFGDALRIGYQNRPDLFALNVKIPEPLYSAVIEVSERYSAKGEELHAIDSKQIYRQLQKIYDQDLRSIAIVLLHSYHFPQHEKIVAEIAKKIGFTQVAVSHQISPHIKLISRGNTTVLDAYVTPLLKNYMGNLQHDLPNTQVLLMQSHGGLATLATFHGKDSLLSGPAGGVIAAIKSCVNAGFDKIISFDMGGTSTDVAHFNGQLERLFEGEVAGHRIQCPMLDIHTIAAGGGSIVSLKQGRYTVGPESAGSNPGPAAYGKGGPLTITDCNVLLGRIQPEFFPHVFGHNGNQSVDTTIVEKKMHDLVMQVNRVTQDQRTAETIAIGFLQIAELNMANAIKKISIQRGYDVSQYILCCFGGAAAQHACAVSDLLGIKKIFIHDLAGVFSAYGLGLAEIRVLKEKMIHKILAPSFSHDLQSSFDELAIAADQALNIHDQAFTHLTYEKNIRLKYEGTDLTLTLPFTALDSLQSNFSKIHQQRYGLTMDKPLIIDAIFLELIAAYPTFSEQKKNSLPYFQKPIAQEFKSVYFNNSWQTTPFYQLHDLQPGQQVFGPAIIIETNNTIVITPGWQAKVTNQNYLLLERVIPLQPKKIKQPEERADPMLLEIFNSLFSSIAEQMGTTLANTAYSVNIKERLDYSCAIFDTRGLLIANAHHIPVHLGSMSASVQTIIHNNAIIKPGDVFVLNNPYNGGTHLPDITVISPVFINGGGTPQFYVASRGHHADIGGISPGSMPPLSTHIDEEGVLIDNFKLVDQGRFREQELLKLFTSHTYPPRNPQQNIADLQAQIAANQKGILELQTVVSRYGLHFTKTYVQHMFNNAEQCVRNLVHKLHNGHFSYRLDNGCKITVAIQVDKCHKNITIDFTGTSGVQNNNFNAPIAVCRATILYVFRTLIAENIPLNEGVMQPIHIIFPDDCMLNPQFPAAIAAGNVETSQCIVDTLYGALGIMAAAQGTMNNFTFGNDQYQYYETLCGGSGAGPGFHGTDAVHTHMTNTRLTDPEVLEQQFPILLECFKIRSGSGGHGHWRGGNGIIRKFRFLTPMTVGILSNRRIIPPYGMAGGQPGKPGKNDVIHANGSKESISSTQLVHLNCNDIFIIATPGGGGYGKKQR